MWRFCAVALSLCLLAPSANAADVSAEQITSAIEAVSADAEKVKAYCEMAQKIEDVGDDEKKAEAAADEIEGYFKTLGEDFDQAWGAGQDAAEGSPEAKAFEDAMTKLDDKCVQ
jgi:opacity protein-like surface antigen